MTLHTYTYNGHEVKTTSWIKAFFLLNAKLIESGVAWNSGMLITRDDSETRRVYTTGVYTTHDRE